MERDDIYFGAKVIHKKHRIYETVIGECKMKKEDGTWEDGIMYQGRDRNSGMLLTFCRTVDSFLESFELLSKIED